MFSPDISFLYMHLLLHLITLVETSNLVINKYYLN